MCIVKVVNDSYLNYSSIFNLVNYALNEKGTYRRVRFFGGYNIDIDRAGSQMVLVKKYYQKDNGREMRHFVVSFEEDISPYDAWILGWQIAAYYAECFQIVFGVHEDTTNIHIHFVLNTVSFTDGRKINSSKYELYRLKNCINQLYKELCEK